ncbi:hypothetical protein CAPTEDRAFT_21264 [Capitella teleta]|uniref:lysoplasmalogenase n=1 Tax=Capitella teleta TaxID=283909 RepID=R7U0T7_CAPTE|nr:hypothetical protein CAPTEDRAFT_21264 [Capitella teleta]|eukprot:ELT99492.1 hypothetical protein CAPTEDRAFT_21264 [Capitella teleta]
MLPLWKLLGFVLYVALFFFACNGFYAWPEKSVSSAFFKVLPVAHCLFIALSSQSASAEHRTLRRSISLGLLFSMAGDALLVSPEDYRLPGGVCFAVAHLLYLRAFGRRPLGGIPVLLSFLIIFAFVSLYLWRHLTDGVSMLAYLLLVHVMAWRATVNFMLNKSLSSLCACLGGILFVASDVILFSEWFVAEHPASPMLVMVTYYLAQAGIAMATTTDVPKMKVY